MGARTVLIVASLSLAQACRPPTPATYCDDEIRCPLGFRCHPVQHRCFRPTAAEDAGVGLDRAGAEDGAGRDGFAPDALAPDRGAYDRFEIDAGHQDAGADTGHQDAGADTGHWDAGADAALPDASTSPDRAIPDVPAFDALPQTWALRFEVSGATSFDPAVTLSDGAPAAEWSCTDQHTASGSSVIMEIEAGDQTVYLAPEALRSHVTKLDAQSDNIMSLPGGLYQMQALVELYLNNNLIDGSIDPFIGQLVTLRSVQIYSNNLSGPIPPEIGNLTQLTDLYLSYNSLEGTIPVELGSLTQLRELHLEDNYLTGSIPAALGHLVNLQRIHLYQCQLTEVEPEIFNNMPQLWELHVHDNQLGQAMVDKIVAQVWQARARFTGTGLNLNVGGSNATPSGTYTDPQVDPGPGASNDDWTWDANAHYPLTGKAKIYDLQNDVRGEGFTVWSVSYTP